jgi:hypothetical protein
MSADPVVLHGGTLFVHGMAGGENNVIVYRPTADTIEVNVYSSPGRRVGPAGGGQGPGRPVGQPDVRRGRRGPGRRHRRPVRRLDPGRPVRRRLDCPVVVRAGAGDDVVSLGNGDDLVLAGSGQRRRRRRRRGTTSPTSVPVTTA